MRGSKRNDIEQHEGKDNRSADIPSGSVTYSKWEAVSFTLPPQEGGQ